MSLQQFALLALLLRADKKMITDIQKNKTEPATYLYHVWDDRGRDFCDCPNSKVVIGGTLFIQHFWSVMNVLVIDEEYFC